MGKWWLDSGAGVAGTGDETFVRPLRTARAVYPQWSETWLVKLETKKRSYPFRYKGQICSKFMVVKFHEGDDYEQKV